MAKVLARPLGEGCKDEIGGREGKGAETVEGPNMHDVRICMLNEDAEHFIKQESTMLDI